MAENPSVVNDASGSNYNIGSGGSIGESQMQYLENLQRLAMKASPKPLSNNEYFPGENQGIEQGRVNGSIIGSQPLFAASNLIPFAMMDEAKRSQAEAEAAYYTKLKPYLDKPLIDAKLKLANPWAQPEFASKIQDVTDKVVESYANKLGGNYMMAQVAASQDKAYNRTLQRFGEYANIYGSVYIRAMETLNKANDHLNYYVSPAQIKSITEFVHAHDSLDKLSIDELAKKGEEYQAKDSMFRLAEVATAHIKEDVVDSAFSKSPLMSTDEENVFIKTKTTGSKGQAEEIFNNIVKANPWLNDDEAQRNLLKTEIEGQVKFGLETSITQVRKQNADQTLALKKMGVDIQNDGSIKFGATRTALTGGIATYPVSFPNDKPIPSSTSMNGYIMYQGSIHHVRTDQSFPMTLKAEYNTGSEDKNLPAGRKTEVNVNFESTVPYETQKTMKMNNIMVPVGDPRGTVQTIEASLTDMDTGQVIKLMGNQTMLVPAEQLDKTVEANFPGMAYVHQKLQGQLQQRQNYTGMGESPDTPIDIPTGADMSFVKDDPNTYYRNKSGKIVNGATLYDLIRKNK